MTGKLLYPRQSLYFAFLSSYTQALFFPSAVGLLFWFFSSPYSPWYSVILTMWSVWWVEWWRIREKELSVRWGTLGSFRAEKRRPKFQGEKGKSGEDNFAQAFPWWKRELRIVASLPTILFFVVILAALLTAIFIVEAFVTQFYQGPLQEYIVRNQYVSCHLPQ
jgi:anoctamin-10